MNQLPQGSSVSLAATHIAGVSVAGAWLTVTDRLKRCFTLSNCTRGSVRLSLVLPRRCCRVMGPPHCSAPALFVTRIKSLTTSTILPAPAAALGSGGGKMQLLQPPSATPSNEQGNAATSQGRIRDVCGAARCAVETCLRVPELGRDGSVGGRPRSNAPPELVGRVLASA